MMQRVDWYIYGLQCELEHHIGKPISIPMIWYYLKNLATLISKCRNKHKNVLILRGPFSHRRSHNFLLFSLFFVMNQLLTRGRCLVSSAGLCRGNVHAWHHYSCMEKGIQSRL